MSYSNANFTLPYLEHFPERGDAPHRILIEHLPFKIGRSMTAHYVIYSRQVSKEHTEIYRIGKDFRIRDLGSTNGTFVNGQRIDDVPLVSGDIVHVAHKELRFGYDPLESLSDSTPEFTVPANFKQPSSLIRGTQHLREMLTEQSVRVVFQPIVRLDSGVIIGYEALGRGTHVSLSPNPAELFGLADQCNLAAELSRLFRSIAVEEAARLSDRTRLFFNIHPAEMGTESLLASLRDLKGALRKCHQVVLEVHEGVVADLDSMRRLRQELKELGIGVAYDDFGAGQARLAELAEVPPDFIKLDRSLIQDIDTATARQDLVQALTRVAKDLGVECIAEGIETIEEAQTSQRLGCRYGQGYLFGRPQPLALLAVEEQGLDFARPISR